MENKLIALVQIVNSIINKDVAQEGGESTVFPSSLFTSDTLQPNLSSRESCLFAAAGLAIRRQT